MKAKWIMAAFFVVVTSALAHAGGPPPMYVVVKKVIMETDGKAPDTVKIWGSFTRYEKGVDQNGKEMYAYSKPTYGYVYLSLPKDTKGNVQQEELKEWQKAAGTGKAVAVGSCGDGGSLLKCPIHQPNETVAKPDVAYTPGYLKMFGELYANEHLCKQPEVAAVVKYATERKQ